MSIRRVATVSASLLLFPVAIDGGDQFVNVFVGDGSNKGGQVRDRLNALLGNQLIDVFLRKEKCGIDIVGGSDLDIYKFTAFRL